MYLNEKVGYIEKKGKIFDSERRKVLFPELNKFIDGYVHLNLRLGMFTGVINEHQRFIEILAENKKNTWFEIVNLLVPGLNDSSSKLSEMTKTLRAQGFKVTHMDIGGGFPIIYNNETLLDFDDYAGWVRDIIAPLGVQIQMEPGRYMVGNAGILLSRVEYIKTTPSRKFMVLDAGMNDLIRPALYDSYHAIKPIKENSSPTQTYDIVGPICESGDIFAKNRECSNVTSGDIVALMSAGAYGFSMASNYNSSPLPVEIMVDGDNVAVINKAQTIEEMMERETIPDWL